MPNGVQGPRSADVHSQMTTSGPLFPHSPARSSLQPSFTPKLTLGAVLASRGASLPRASRDVAQLSAV